VHDLPPRFVAKLESILKAHESIGQSYVPVIGLPSIRNRPSEPETDAQPPAQEWRCDVMLADRKLRGLGTVLEILHAAHLDMHGEAGELLLGQYVVDGLLAVCQHLVASARDALRGAM